MRREDVDAPESTTNGRSDMKTGSGQTLQVSFHAKACRRQHVSAKMAREGLQDIVRSKLQRINIYQSFYTVI